MVLITVCMIGSTLRLQMPNNLLIWPNLQATELMVLLHERMGGTWQGDLSVRRPSKLYIPMFGPTCRVMLKFDGPKIVAIEPGEAFDTTQWEQISNEIENSVLRGPTRVGREYSFSSRRVTGSWRGRHSGVQILPPPSNAPHPTIQPADYPFILEFPLMNASIDHLTNHRRIRKHRDLTLLLNILLFGGAKLMGLRPPHVWVLDLDDLGRNSEWVPQGFRAPLGPAIIDSLSAPAADQLEEVAPEQYDEVVVSDELRVPSDLDESICLYEALLGVDREKFDRAAFWFSTSSRMWDISMSASFAALAFAIESMTTGSNVHEVQCHACGSPIESGPTKLFRNFLAAYVPGASLARDRNDMYSLRSDVVHGEQLVELDREIPIVGAWTPPGFKELEQYRAMWQLTRTALRNWLKNRHRYLQQAREVCAYFHWIKRDRPLWEADIDWAFAEQEFPA